MFKKPLPRFLQSRKENQNGRVEELHAPRSILFRKCWNEEGELREFQLKTVDVGRGSSFYRCVICDALIEIPDEQEIKKK